MLDRLELPDGPAELLALLGVADRQVQGGACRAGQLSQLKGQMVLQRGQDLFVGKLDLGDRRPAQAGQGYGGIQALHGLEHCGVVARQEPAVVAP
ncbi:hypothetical protein D3C87_1469130 [compost metagenome]